MKKITSKLHFQFLLPFVLISSLSYGADNPLRLDSQGSLSEPRNVAVSDQLCIELVALRDGELHENFSASLQKYDAFNEGLEIARQNKEQVDTAYNRFLVSPTGELYAGFLGAIKTTADVLGLVFTATPQGRAVNSATIGVINSIDHAYELVDQGAEQASYRIVLERAGPIGQIINGIRAISEDLGYLNDLASAHKGAKAEFNRQMLRLNAAISRAQREVNQEQGNYIEIIEIVNQIDRQCGAIGLAENEEDFAEGLLNQVEANSDAGISPDDLLGQIEADVDQWQDEQARLQYEREQAEILRNQQEAAQQAELYRRNQELAVQRERELLQYEQEIASQEDYEFSDQPPIPSTSTFENVLQGIQMGIDIINSQNGSGFGGGNQTDSTDTPFISRCITDPTWDGCWR